MGKRDKDKPTDISKINEDDQMLDDLAGLGLEALGYQLAAEKEAEERDKK